MNVSDILKLKYPNADFLTDIQLSDHGQGIVITKWNLPEPMPSKAQLDAWAVELQPQYEAQQNKIVNAPIYVKLDAIDAKSIRALRANDTQRLADLEAQAVELRGKLK